VDEVRGHSSGLRTGERALGHSACQLQLGSPTLGGHRRDSDGHSRDPDRYLIGTVRPGGIYEPHAVPVCRHRFAKSNIADRAVSARLRRSRNAKHANRLPKSDAHSGNLLKGPHVSLAINPDGHRGAGWLLQREGHGRLAPRRRHTRASETPMIGMKGKQQSVQPLAVAETAERVAPLRSYRARRSTPASEIARNAKPRHTSPVPREQVQERVERRRRRPTRERTS
jgi:hypothetical protein